MCLAAIISSELHVRSSQNFFCMFPMAVAWSSSGSVVIHYVLPVFVDDIIFAQAKVTRCRRPAEAHCTRSLGLGYKLCTVIPVACQWTHRTTFRARKITSQVATPGAESAVYDCLVVVAFVPQEQLADSEEAGKDDDVDSETMVHVGDGFYVAKQLYDRLFDYQYAGILFLWRLFRRKKGGILGDDMG